MDLVFNNVYLLTAMAETDPSLEVFFKLMLVSRLYNHYVKANPGVRAALYRLHDGWLVTVTKTLITKNGIVHGLRTWYRHPDTRQLHRYGGPAIADSFHGYGGPAIVDTWAGRDTYGTYYIQDYIQGYGPRELIPRR